MAKVMIFCGLMLVLASCKSVYNVGQTPDDVYYSPAIESGGYVLMQSDPEDRYLRWKVKNRRWNSLNDFDYWNDVRYNYYCNCNWTGYYYSGYAYGFPYYPIYPGTHNPVRPVRKPAVTPVAAYGNNNYSNKNKNYNPKFGTVEANSETRRVYPSRSNSGSSTNPVRSFEPGSAAGISGGKSGGYNSGSTGKRGGRD